MAATLYTSFTGSSISTVRLPRKLYSPVKTHVQVSRGLRFSPKAPALKLRRTSTSGFCTVCCYKNNTPQESSKKDSGFNRRMLKTWDVPWNWQTISLTLAACGLSIETIVVLAVLYSLTKSFSPLPDDIYRYDWREPFNLEKGWLLWAGIGLGGALAADAVTGAAMSLFNAGPPHRETDALVQLLPLIGASSVSTASLLGMLGILAPVLEETVFRGFFMVSLTKWLSTPLSVFFSAYVFAVAHLTPRQFPKLLVSGIVLGFSYAQTRNLLTPITIHAFWNSGIVLLLTFLKLRGYDVKELLRVYCTYR